MQGFSYRDEGLELSVVPHSDGLQIDVDRITEVRGVPVPVPVLHFFLEKDAFLGLCAFLDDYRSRSAPGSSGAV